MPTTTTEPRRTPPPLFARALLVLGALLLAGGLCVFVRRLDLFLGARFLRCPFFALTGLYCPGCGSTRAIRCLLRLDLAGAFRMNPMATVLLPLCGLYVLARLYSFLRYGCDRVSRRIPERPLYAVLALLAVFFVLRNLPFAWLSALRPPA